MTAAFYPAHGSNFTAGRANVIDRIVLHYTGGDGDTAENNGNYFQGKDRKASAHYFVDEDSIVQSVRDTDIAWHAGDWDMNCRSIGIEMCSRKYANGKYYIPEKTVENAVKLTKELMEKYGIGVDGVIRHYDVTKKACPAPWVENPKLWEDFKRRLTAVERPSAWAEEACAWAVKQGIFQGDGKGGYDWQAPVTREQLAVILYRLYGK